MSLLTIERCDEIAVVHLNRPPVNAIDLDLLHAAEAAFTELDANPRPRAIVLTGTGRAFSAGLDLQKVPKYGPTELREMICAVNSLLLHLYAEPLPLVAAVNGHAIAGGLCLALACDYRVCADADCKLGLTETRAGIPYPANPMAILKAELAPHVSRQLVLAARNVTPQQALGWGMVDELQPREMVLPRAIEAARDFASAPSDAYGHIKHQLRGDLVRQLQRTVTEESDPLIAHWFGRGAKDAAAKVLAGKAGA